MLVEQNRFSRQLYYALHAFEITIPPLRMRRGSIPALVNNKLRSLEKRFSTRLKIDDDASLAWFPVHGLATILNFTASSRILL